MITSPGQRRCVRVSRTIMDGLLEEHLWQSLLLVGALKSLTTVFFELLLCPGLGVWRSNGSASGVTTY